MFTEEVKGISVLQANKEVKSRKTPAHTLKNRANKCKTCWGYGTVSIRESTKYPIWSYLGENGQKIYSINAHTVICSCQH